MLTYIYAIFNDTQSWTYVTASYIAMSLNFFILSKKKTSKAVKIIWLQIHVITIEHLLCGKSSDGDLLDKDHINTSMKFIL